jgi:hypothetical protein
LALKFFRKRKSILIRYEDFANYPEKILRIICNHIGVAFEPNMMCLGKKTKHMIGGNPSRINATEIIKPEAEWKYKLDKDLLRLFNKKAGFLNRYFGYVDKL